MATAIPKIKALRYCNVGSGSAASLRPINKNQTMTGKQIDVKNNKTIESVVSFILTIRGMSPAIVKMKATNTAIVPRFLAPLYIERAAKRMATVPKIGGANVTLIMAHIKEKMASV